MITFAQSHEFLVPHMQEHGALDSPGTDVLTGACCAADSVCV